MFTWTPHHLAQIFNASFVMKQSNLVLDIVIEKWLLLKEFLQILFY
jgi:hypothetical protein